MAKRGGLGRGLSALIPGAPEAGELPSGLLEDLAPRPHTEGGGGSFGCGPACLFYHSVFSTLACRPGPASERAGKQYE